MLAMNTEVKLTFSMFLCNMSVSTAYMLRKSYRFWRAMYNCFSSCSFNACYSKRSISGQELKSAEGAYSVVLEVRVLHNLRADLSTSEVVLTRGIAQVVCALLRAMYLGQYIYTAK